MDANNTSKTDVEPCNKWDRVCDGIGSPGGVRYRIRQKDKSVVKYNVCKHPAPSPSFQLFNWLMYHKSHDCVMSICKVKDKVLCD